MLRITHLSDGLIHVHRWVFEKIFFASEIAPESVCKLNAGLCALFEIADVQLVCNFCTHHRRASDRHGTEAIESIGACPSPRALSKCSLAPWRTHSRRRRCVVGVR